MKQLPLRMAAATVQTFGNFIAGANEAAVAALSARPMPSATGIAVAPIYLWGPAGVGKTHLLMSRAGSVAAQEGASLAFGAEQPAPWAWQDGAGLLVLDGCDAYDEAQQHAAFTLFVEAATAQVPVIAAGRLPPVDLPVREDLRTRLGWGLVFQIQPASETEARDALQREARRRGLALPIDVLDYLLRRFSRDLGSLMGWLDALDDYALSEKRAVNLALLKRMLAEDASHTGLAERQPDQNPA